MCHIHFCWCTHKFTEQHKPCVQPDTNAQNDLAPAGLGILLVCYAAWSAFLCIWNLINTYFYHIMVVIVVYILAREFQPRNFRTLRY